MCQQYYKPPNLLGLLSSKSFLRNVLLSDREAVYSLLYFKNMELDQIFVFFNMIELPKI